MDPLQLISGLLPALGGLVGGPVGGAIGQVGGALGAVQMPQRPEPETPSPSRIQTTPEAPGSGVTGFRASPPRPETAPPGFLGQPTTVRSQANNPGALTPVQQGIDLDRSRRVELLRELLGDIRNG